MSKSVLFRDPPSVRCSPSSSTSSGAISIAEMGLFLTGIVTRQMSNGALVQSTQLMEEAILALEKLKDNRRLLLDRLSDAHSLYLNSQIIFPARRQFLLDWLLDSFYRLLKSSTPDKVSQLVCDEHFWKFFLLLLETDDASSSKKRGKIVLNRPLIPIFTCFLEHQNFPITGIKSELVSRCITAMLVELPEAVLKSQAKYIQELLKQESNLLINDRMKILLLWAEGQHSKFKLFMDVYKFATRLLAKADNGATCQQLFRTVLLAPEVIKELHCRVKSESFDLVDELCIGSSMPFFTTLCQQSLHVLSALDFRLMIARIFVHLVENHAEDSFSLAESLCEARIALDQSDIAWDICSSKLLNLVLGQPYRPKLLLQISKIEISLVLPSLPSLLHSIQYLDEEWLCFIAFVANKQSETRQLDQFIHLLVKYLNVDLPMDFLISNLLSPLRRVHMTVAKQIIDSLPMEGTNAMLLLRLLIMINPGLCKDKVRKLIMMMENPSTLADIQARLDVIELFCERSGELLDENDIVISSDHAGLAIQRFIRGTAGSIPDKALSSDKVCLKYLPALLQRGIIPSISKIPKVVFASCIFWESLCSPDDFISKYLDHPDTIGDFISNMPDGVVLSPAVALLCLERLDSIFADKLLKPQQDLPVELDEKLIMRLWTHGSSFTRIQLCKRGYMKESTKLILKELLKGAQPSIELVKILVACLDPKDANSVLDSILFIGCRTLIAPAIMAAFWKQTPKLYENISSLIGIDVDEQYKWQLAIHICNYGGCDSVPISFADALSYYARNDIVTAREIITFLRDPSEVQSIQSVDELGDIRKIQLLDVLMLQSLNIQNVVCPIVDEIMVHYLDGAFIEQNASDCLKLLHHRLLCGGSNIGLLQQDILLDKLLWIISQLISTQPVVDMCSIVSLLMIYHWQQLMSRRPLLISFLQRILERCNEAPRKVNRLINDFAAHRQSDQHYYVYPLLLAFAHLTSLDASMRISLTPSMCALIRHIDQQQSARKALGHAEEKYFDSDPFARLMLLIETDDAKLVMRSLIKTYQDEYKFTGQA